jgi:hypothetical protein
VSLKRKLVVGGVVLVLAGAATGAGLAASGNGRSLPPAPRHLYLLSTTRAGFLQATAQYLGTDVATLRHETKGGGRTLAAIAKAKRGRSEKQLAAMLVTAASTKLQLISDRAMSTAQQGALRRLLRPRIAGFLDDTCPLAVSALGRHLAWCPGMSA